MPIGKSHREYHKDPPLFSNKNVHAYDNDVAPSAKHNVDKNNWLLGQFGIQSANSQTPVRHIV